jgi:hypothetical protein
MKASIILVLMLLVSRMGLAATLRVPSQFSDIQLAIDASSDGDTILVSPGTYSYEIGLNIIGKSVHVMSAKGPTVTSIENHGQIPSPWESGSYAFNIESVPGPCTISGFTMAGHFPGDMSMNDFTIMVTNSNVRIVGNIFINNQQMNVIAIRGLSEAVIEYNVFSTNRATSINIGDGTSATIQKNTLSGNVWYEQILMTGNNCHPVIRNNIIVNAKRSCPQPSQYCYAHGVQASCPPGNIVFECNDVWNNEDANYAGTLPDQTGMNGNISVDPLFCGAAGSDNFYLQSSSPCAEQNVPSICSGERMGCCPTKCTVGVETQSWGSIKSLLDNKKK